MDDCRLSLNVTGAFLHPLGDQTPIDCRYGETLKTAELPDRQILYVEARTRLDFGRVKNPRAVVIHNVSNQGEQVQPSEEERVMMERRVLFVGFGENQAPSIELPPSVPGGNQFGGGQFLWLARGASVWLDVTPGYGTVARVAIFPGNRDG